MTFQKRRGKESSFKIIQEQNLSSPVRPKLYLPLLGLQQTLHRMACDSMISMHPKCLPRNLATAEEFLQPSIFSATWHDPSWSLKLHLEVNPMPQVTQVVNWTMNNYIISVTLLAATVTRSIRKPEGGEWKPAMSAVQYLFQHEAATKTSHISLVSDSPPPTHGRTKSPFKQQAEAQKHACRSVLLTPVGR